MYPVQPDSTVTVNCDENPLECHRCTGGGVCFELAVPPPPPSRCSPARRRRPTTTRRCASSSPSPCYPPSSSSRSRSPRSSSTAADAGSCAGGGAPRRRRVRCPTMTVEYRGGVGRGGDCAVCLGEFSDGELVRLLPRCAHPFHASCIDTWLRAHVNCPLCRSPVVVVPSDLPAAALEPGADVAQHEAREVLDEMPQSEVESHGEGSEDSEVSSDIQSEDTAAAADDNGRVTPNPIRRSASMDSPMFLVPVPENQDDDTQCNHKLSNPSAQEMRVFRVKGRDASAISSSSCQAGGFKIGRSMSSSGLGFFFSRSGRSSGTVLPL
ncbi:hypothetical protein PR202_ga15568 [Eleusine coracana subsp. coracana]|uniref:RING-type E3 ubiquitin transferase n=1 Tax=Eleusine coracana subsp. coracana TaxID=191504 RepID=A0AAV5CKJ4_ELECO|nr:hypothetical protein PR202_ga15568 [Eleusine coracana subsp. coracana]